MTIDPLVSGQQLITSPDDEGGNAISISSSAEVVSGVAAECFADLCFALQQACASIDADMAPIGCSEACAGALSSLIAVRA